MGLKKPEASQAHEATTKENTKALSGLTRRQSKRDGQSQEVQGGTRRVPHGHEDLQTAFCTLSL